MKKLSIFLAVLCTGLTVAQAPPNDICQNAITLPSAGVYPGTNVNGTASLFGTGTCGLAGVDVWYKYTAVNTGNKLVASTCSPGSSTFSSGVDIFTGTCLGPPVTASCNTTWCEQGGTITGGRAATTTTAGVTYLIRVKSVSGTGTFNLYVDEIPAAATNGTCATPISVGNGVNSGFSNFNEPAALAPGFTPCTSAGKDVFFTYLATGSGNTTVRTCFPTPTAVPAVKLRDSVVAIYASCSGGTPIACNDNGCGGTPGTGSNLSTVSFPSTAGAVYIIQVAGTGSGAGASEGFFDLEVIPPPVNDECATPIALNAGVNGPFTNQSSSTSAGFSPSCGQGFNDLFYSYTPTCGAPTTISTGCNGFDTILTVYGSCAGPELACNDNDPNGFCGLSSVVTVNMTAGTTYLIRVAAWGSGSFGNFNVDITPGYGLNWASPLGPGTLQFSVCNGPPGGTYYLFASLVQGGFPNGWFYGVDITLTEIASQIAFGFPFVGPLNGSGNFTSPIFGGVPSGLGIYSIAFAVPPGSSAPSTNSGAKSYITP